MQCFFYFGLHCLGQFVEHIGRLMHPATLLFGLRVYFAQSLPEAQSAVSCCQLWAGRKPTRNQAIQQLKPAGFGLAIAFFNSNQFLAACSVSPSPPASTNGHRGGRCCKYRQPKGTRSACHSNRAVATLGAHQSSVP